MLKCSAAILKTLFYLCNSIEIVAIPTELNTTQVKKQNFFAVNKKVTK
jgi:hypothetical protein